MYFLKWPKPLMATPCWPIVAIVNHHIPNNKKPQNSCRESLTRRRRLATTRVASSVHIWPPKPYSIYRTIHGDPQRSKRDLHVWGPLVYFTISSIQATALILYGIYVVQPPRKFSWLLIIIIIRVCAIYNAPSARQHGTDVTATRTHTHLTVHVVHSAIQSK